MINFACSSCGTKLRVQENLAGRRGRCPTCKQPITVPDVAPPTPVPTGNLTGTPSSLHQAGIDAGVTLDSPSTGARGEPSPVAELLSGHARQGSRYVVAKEIARGGMGAVVRAVDCDIRREVAIKYMLDDSERAKKARFVEEAQITGQLEHPNIVPIHELGIDAQKRLFFSMKMVKGRSLAQVIDELRSSPAAEKTWSLGRLLTLFNNVCYAMAYAHSRGVIHRDLKPANIMLGDFGETYVMDWGLAKVLTRNGSSAEQKPSSPLSSIETSASMGVSATQPTTEGSSGSHSGSTKVVTSREVDGELTQDGAILGTPSYMPPEQAHGEVLALDNRSDVYSLGAILYELLTLLPPVEKTGGHVAVLLRVVEGEIKPPEQRSPDRARAGKVPKELAAVAMKALALKPEDRYQSVERLRRDIERFQEGRSVSAKEDRLWESAVKFVKRNKGFSIATATAAVLLAIVMSISLVVNYRARVLAENNFAQYLQEQAERRKQAKTSVPAFVEAAHLAVARKDFAGAHAQLGVALDYDPEHIQANMLKAQLLVSEQNFQDARKILSQVTEQQLGDSNAVDLLAVLPAAATEDPTILGAISDVLYQQGVGPLAETLVDNKKQLAALYRKRIEAAWPGAGARLMVAPDGTLSLDLYGRKEVRDLSPLSGIPFSKLLMKGTSVADLSPLMNMPLMHLDLVGCKDLKDLSPLRGLKLTKLLLANCTLANDISPLAGMPLAFLDLGTTQVRDLMPLAGMRLEHLSLYGCLQVEDIAVLRGMPLKSLNLTSCKNVRDLTPIRDLPVEELVLAGCSASDLTLLHGMPLTTLDLGGCPISDLTPLQAHRLTNLFLVGCGDVQDLTPLRGMPLGVLDLRHTAVRDLTPLVGMPLKSLDIGDCQQIEDLSPMAKLPLTKLMLSGCRRVTDLFPLRGLQLNSIFFTPKNISSGIDALREMKSLRTITFASGRPGVSPSEFWPRYDAGEFNK